MWFGLLCLWWKPPHRYIKFCEKAPQKAGTYIRIPCQCENLPPPPDFTTHIYTQFNQHKCYHNYKWDVNVFQVRLTVTELIDSFRSKSHDFFVNCYLWFATYALGCRMACYYCLWIKNGLLLLPVDLEWHDDLLLATNVERLVTSVYTCVMPNDLVVNLLKTNQMIWIHREIMPPLEVP